jgi:hypothetical protein
MDLALPAFDLILPTSSWRHAIHVAAVLRHIIR